MAVPSSGELRLYTDIGTELEVAQSSVSLGTMSNTAGFTEPHAMSEFYGYSAIPPGEVYLDSNGVTIKATSDTVVGEEYVLSGVSYIIVSTSSAARTLISGGRDASTICTTKITTLLRGLKTVGNADVRNWDVSNCTNLYDCFYGNTTFNRDISYWDVSSVTSGKFTRLMYKASSFNQNLSGWCVINQTTYPNSFDTGATAWTLPNSRPVWGTCP